MVCTAAYHKNSVKIIDSVVSDWLCEKGYCREYSRKASVSLGIEFKSYEQRDRQTFPSSVLLPVEGGFLLGKVEIKGKKRQVKAKCKHAEPESGGQEEVSAWHGKTKV